MKLASLDKFPLAGSHLNWFISCSITEGMSITQEVRVVTHLHTVFSTPRIFLIGAGLAMLARCLTGVLTQSTVQSNVITDVSHSKDLVTFVFTYFITVRHKCSVNVWIGVVWEDTLLIGPIAPNT